MGQFFFVQSVIDKMNMNHSIKQRAALFALFIGFAFGVSAQTSVDVSNSKNQNFIDPVDVRFTTVKANKKLGYDAYYDQLIVEYQERMVQNVKKHQKLAKEMQKPQYSDHAYFGHKRKPKKRPVGKRKFCKECEIVH
jgi:hypothetical protein